MRTFNVTGLAAVIVVALAASTGPSAAMVIYPWCANYGGGRSGGGGQNCGFTSFQQDPIGEWRLLRCKPVVSAIPAAADVFPAPMAVTVDKACAFWPAADLIALIVRPMHVR